MAVPPHRPWLSPARLAARLVGALLLFGAGCLLLLALLAVPTLVVRPGFGIGIAIFYALVLAPPLGIVGWLLWVTDSPWPHGHPFRVTTALVGVAALVYGLSCFSGRWLGTPPWWVVQPGREVTDSRTPLLHHDQPVGEVVVDRREWFSGAVAAIGLGLFAVGAWPRRRRRDPTAQTAP